MNHFLVLLEKEAREILRTKKLLVLVCVFLFFAFISPLLARFMGEFFEFLLPAAEAEQFMALFPAPTWIDSYVQFYSNATQMGTIVIILLFMGLILREKRSGTADLVFCKGVSPASFVLAKFTVAGIAALLCLLVAILINYGYTVFLFGEGGALGHVMAGAGAYGLFVLLILAWVILASTLAKSTGISAVLGFMGFMGLLALSAIPRLGRFVPGGLMTQNIPLTLGNFYPDFAAHLGVAAGLTAMFLVLAVWILKRQEL
ncbi:MAG: ABC transporter permease [Defluviitaleaceae bacterium]|nr:ABC transporter permease [Defluviitaleaceae bacterium]MCL2239771.1 ABC transporter permease [Defluviitaleaceae bacterium]